MKKISLKKNIIIILFSIFLFSCNSVDNNVKDTDLDKLTLKEAIKEYSRIDKKMVSVFHGTMRVESIYLAPKLVEKFKKVIDEKELRESNLNFPLNSIDKSSFLVAFYTPKSEANDLNKMNSIWNLVLKTKDKKYSSIKVDLLSRKNIIFKYFFIDNQKFSRFYIVTFPKIDSKKIELIFSTMGTQLHNIWIF